VTATAESPRCGPLAVTAWHRVHQQLTSHSGGWEDWPPGSGRPLVEGTLIRLAAARPAPGFQPLEPLRLRASDPQASPQEVTVLRQAYLRRFDLEVGHRCCRSSGIRFSRLLLLSFFLRFPGFRLGRCPAGAGVVAGRAVPALAELG
jgi:hypothetical protein